MFGGGASTCCAMVPAVVGKGYPGPEGDAGSGKGNVKWGGGGGGGKG